MRVLDADPPGGVVRVDPLADGVADESSFDEPASHIANSIYGEGQNPKSSDANARFW